MPSYQFTLIAEGPDLQSDELIEALYEAGCDDATVGRADGTQYLDFDRQANTLDEAILSAVADLEQMGHGVEVVRLADAGLVSMAEIAARAGRTRESVRLLIAGKRGPGGFPPPVTDPRSRYRLWRWSEVDRWFTTQISERPTNHDDEVRAAINAGLELRHYSRHLDPARPLDLRQLGI